MGNRYPNISCEWLNKNYKKNVGLRGVVGQHLSSCATCSMETKAFFDTLRRDFDIPIAEFRAAAETFKAAVCQLAELSETKGSVDASTAFLVEICWQLADDADRYYNSAPHDNIRAVGWLPRAFTVCRAFESERYVEKNFLSKKLRVDKMPVDPASPEEKTFGEVTSPSSMLKENLSYGTFQYNRVLQDQIVEEIAAGKYVHALVLICDSPKHGVMSAFLNVACTFHPEQVYSLGLRAARNAIRTFCEANRLQRNESQL